MNQQYFIVVLAHSLHGRIRRIHVPHTVIYAVVALAFLGIFSLFGFVSSYARMAWKVANYNSLRAEVETIRAKYQTLQKQANQTNQNLATLQVFASEVSAAYGIKQKMEGPNDISAEGRLVPTFQESIAEYNFLKSANFSKFPRSSMRRWQTDSDIMKPSMWPVAGRLLSYWGRRADPFSGEGAFHKGLDISAGIGTPVKAAADGVIKAAEYSSGYGKLVIIDHGGGLSTYYGHLSRFSVIAGQEVRRGEVIAYSGATGRVTAPHLHWEVRRNGSPVNPYPYLKGALTGPVRKDFAF